MNPGRYFIPNMRFAPYMQIPTNPMIRNALLNTNNSNIFSRIFNGLRTYNWKGLISGANKTLNVVNQTIPLIRQAKPMVNNVKSMVQLAKAFGNETNNKKHTQVKKIQKNINNNKTTTINNDYPTFFV